MFRWAPAWGLAACLLAAPASGGELRLATWAVSWMTDRPAGDPALPADVGPKAPEDVARLRGYADALEADVVALEQVDGARNAARLFPPDRYDVTMTGDDTALGAGFAIRKTLRWAANPDLTALNVGGRLRSGSDVTVQTPGGPLRLLAVHLKAGCRQDALDDPRRPQCATLAAQLAVLEDWAAKRRLDGGAFAILGDFSRWMDGDDPFLAALRGAAPLDRATEGRSDPCWGGGPFADHILLGGPARAWLEPDSLRVSVYRESGADARKRLSGHCPVSIRLRLPDAADGR